MQAAIEAARELVGPIIAMTITLAAVYTPVGIQGGLTGALFREFAFTLAAAVIVSGIVALTLSPMMGAKLLRAGDSERGFAGWINRRFDRIRTRYMRMLSRTLAYRPVVLVVWAGGDVADGPVLPVLAAGAGSGRGSGVVFGIVQGAANSTIDQTRLFTQQVYDVYPVDSGGGQHLPDYVADRRRRHGDEAVERTHEDGPAAADGVDGAVVRHSRNSRHPADAAGAAGRWRSRSIS